MPKKQEQQNVADQIQEFCKNSINFLEKCKKPDKAEYLKIL